jgi:hydrogenase/urease accessory protein HupE
MAGSHWPAWPLLLVLVLCGALPAAAHEVRPAYLRIQATGATTAEGLAENFDVLWRKPTGGEILLDIEPVLPENCEVQGGINTWLDGGVETSRWLALCPGGIDGRQLRVAGLEATVTDALVRYERANETTQIARLTPDRPGVMLTESESILQVAGTYFVLGVEHILFGIDHLLFVLALLLIVDGWRKLVSTVTAFTIAHSVTLAAASLGLVSVPQQPVEAVIALSIVFVCMEIVHWRQGKPGLTRRAPWIVAFVFGLLHGFGFAGALSDIGLPEHAIPSALLFFNVGVEAGQLIFIAAVMAFWAVLRQLTLPTWAWRVPVYGIGAMAAFWTIERIAGFGA